MKKITYALSVMLSLSVSAHLYAEENNLSMNENVNKSREIGYFNGEIWQPDSFSSGAGGSVKAKVSCADISVDLNMDGMMDKVERILGALLGNPRVLMINGAIKFVARSWAVQQCGGSLKDILTEYPEQAQKLSACIQKGMGDANKVSMGTAVGTASFAEFETENNPGVFSKISGCITGELGDEYGDGFRRCIDRQTEDNVNTIRDVLNWAMEHDFNMNMLARQECILDEQQKEQDIVKAINTYGGTINPDGTFQDCSGDECINKKIAWSSFALTDRQDKEIKKHLLDYIDSASRASKIQEIKKGPIYGFILDWYKKTFVDANIWQTEKGCNEVLPLSADEVVYRIGSDRGDLDMLYMNDPAALVETAEVIKNVCVSYMGYARDRMFTTAAETPMPGFSSAVQQETWKLGQSKLSVDMELLNMSHEAKKSAQRAKDRARKKKNEEFNRRIDEAIKKVRQ